MKILFAASRTWSDTESVAAILNSIVGDGPVHLVVGAETRGPEAYVVEWARKRAKLRRTFIDVIRAGREFGPMSEREQWIMRRDAHMVKVGGYDAVVLLSRKLVRQKKETSRRLGDIARMADEAGIPVKFFDYDETSPKFDEGAAL